MDEVAGRRVAQNMKLPITDSVGILIRAAKSGMMTAGEAEDALGRIKRANRHISEALINRALELIRGE